MRKIAYYIFIFVFYILKKKSTDNANKLHFNSEQFEGSVCNNP